VVRILVTGGAGFIGTHTCLSLLDRGHEIIVLDSFINSHENSLQRVLDLVKINLTRNIDLIEVVKGDIRNENTLEKLFSASEEFNKPIQAVIHFAGLKSVSDSINKPLLYWDINVNGSINLFNVMENHNCRTIVFSSSATIYGISDDKPIIESSTIKAVNPYGNTKVAIEQILNDIYNSSPDKWKIANLRYFNPVGAHSSGLIGESPLDIPNNIFPYITQVASGKLEKLNVFGNDWPTKDGTGVRDYIHVMDLADGHIAALDYLLESESQIINLNLGTGIGTSVLELIHIFESANNIKIPYVYSSRRNGDVASVIANNSKAISCLKWFPKRSLKQMCIDGWKWQSLNPEGYK
tara:strand:- start:907 stop:1962 length:1056 start_codon:yes stop_codon:yes gene_type:complete